MRKRNETRKFKKIRKGTKNYSTRRNKSGGLPLLRYFTSDGRLLEEFKKKIRDVSELKALLDTPNPHLEERENILQIGTKVSDLKKRKDVTNVNFTILKDFVDNNNERLSNILEDNKMQIEKRDFYKKIREEVTRLTSSGAGAGDSSDGSSGSSGETTSVESDNPAEETINKKGDNVYVYRSLKCPTPNDDDEPPFFTCDYDIGDVLENSVCKLCFKSKRNHIPESQQGGGSRRRRRNTRLRKNKTRRNGKCRACKCPGGCKRSTCPCYRGRSKPCCTKKCKSRGHGCRC